MGNARDQNPERRHFFAVNELLFKQPLFGDVTDAYKQIAAVPVLFFDGIYRNVFQSVRFHESFAFEHQAFASRSSRGNFTALARRGACPQHFVTFRIKDVFIFRQTVIIGSRPVEHLDYHIFTQQNKRL